MDRAQWVDGKNGIICLVMLTPMLWSLKYQQLLIFFVFSADYSIFFADSVVFFIFLPSKGYLTPKHINHTIF